jgi:hypothetical protein
MNAGNLASQVPLAMPTAELLGRTAISPQTMSAGLYWVRGPVNVSAKRTDYWRKELKPARISSDRNFGCSQAAKCPPLGSLL